MRIISGNFKGFKLFSSKSSNVRPTADSVKERIFAVIGSCENKNVLDLFAGFGGLGLEAVSRGANSVQFVDISSDSLATVKKNITKLDVATKCKLHKKNAESFLKKNTETFDLIFLDPPYEHNLLEPVLKLICEKKTLSTKGIVVVERSAKEQINKTNFNIFKEIKAGNTLLSFLENINNSD